MIVETGLHELGTYHLISIVLFFLIENVILFLVAVSIGKWVEYDNTKSAKKDHKWIIATLLINTLITFAGYQLYLAKIIVLDFTISFSTILLDTILLIVAMDFFMFCFHYAVHQFKWFYKIHQLHHTHIHTSVYSLFVLHPIETFGFGLIWLSLISLFSFNAISIILYLTLNLFYGIFGHLKTDLFPQFWYKNKLTKWISTTKFHSDHHQNETHNYGFYFTIWDKIFKTEF